MTLYVRRALCKKTLKVFSQTQLGGPWSRGKLKKKNTQHQSPKAAQFESKPGVKEDHEILCTCILIFTSMVFHCLFHQPKLHLYEPVIAIPALGEAHSGDRDNSIQQPSPQPNPCRSPVLPSFVHSSQRVVALFSHLSFSWDGGTQPSPVSHHSSKYLHFSKHVGFVRIQDESRGRTRTPPHTKRVWMETWGFCL